ncbi:MAG: ROK family protein [Ignavibacteriales bacterium]|nr:ROK family protein [Ignavibacteriales bacterium]
MNTKKTYAIGVDLGATTVKAGVVTKSGFIPDQLSVDSKAKKGPAVVLQQIIFTIQEIFGKYNPSECLGIGIGTPGVVSITDSTVQHPPNFTDWAKVDVAKQIRNKFKIPVYIENDANCAAIAEARFGAGIEFKDFLFVIWGTGIGGGVILDRKIYRGPYGGAGEIGHVSIDYNGRLCNCGNYGCIESYVGQRYLSQRTKEILLATPKDNIQTKIEKLVDGDLNLLDPEIISQAAEEGDPIAIGVLEEAGTLLGYALSSILNVLDLRVVVIGGGVSAAPAFVYDAIIKSLRSRILKPHKEGVRVIRAKLGNTAGIIGAASLVL